jgi:hypothetical protein
VSSTEPALAARRLSRRSGTGARARARGGEPNTGGCNTADARRCRAQQTARRSPYKAAAALGDSVPRRARTRDQGRIAWNFAEGFARSLPTATRKALIFRRAPRLEIEFEGDGGGHVLRVIPADGKSALGGAPTLAILDERGHWERDKGDQLEHALLSGLGKRGGRALVISTSARRQLERRLALGLGKMPDDALVFMARDGGPRVPTYLSTEWRTLREAAGVGTVTWHALRHTHASQLIDANVDIVTISRRLGHKNPNITLQIYAHLFKQRDDKAATAINAALADLGHRQ